MERNAPAHVGIAALTARCEDGYRMEPHAHEDHEINLVVQGAGRYDLPDGAALALATGDICLLPAGGTHALVPTQTPLILHTFVFLPSVVQRVLGPDHDHAARAALATTHASVPPRCVTAPDLFLTLDALHGQILMEAGRDDAWREAGLHRIAAWVAIQFLRLLEEGDPNPMDATARRVLETKVWMDRHPGLTPSLEELAARAHLSPSHFSATFRKLMGASPKAYLNRRRLAYAADLLIRTGRPILDIALAAGFGSLPHFNRAFKAFAGATPGAFRKKRQQKR